MQIRHTQGPIELTIGQTALVRDQWTETELTPAELPPALVSELGIEWLEPKPAIRSKKEVIDGG